MLIALNASVTLNRSPKRGIAKRAVARGEIYVVEETINVETFFILH